MYERLLYLDLGEHSSHIERVKIYKKLVFLFKDIASEYRLNAESIYAGLDSRRYVLFDSDSELVLIHGNTLPSFDVEIIDITFLGESNE